MSKQEIESIEDDLNYEDIFEKDIDVIDLAWAKSIGMLPKQLDTLKNIKPRQLIPFAMVMNNEFDRDRINRILTLSIHQKNKHKDTFLKFVKYISNATKRKTDSDVINL